MATPSSNDVVPSAVAQASPAALDGSANGDAAPLAGASAAVLVKSEGAPADAPVVVGHDFNTDMAAGRVDYDALLKSYANVGFQATHFGQAVDRINDMVRWCDASGDRGEGRATCGCDRAECRGEASHAVWGACPGEGTASCAFRLLHRLCQN